MPIGIYPKEKRKGMFEKGHKFIKGGEKGWFKKGNINERKGTGKKKICLTCKKEFVATMKKGQGDKFCSRKCFGIYSGQRQKGVPHFNQRGEKSYQWKGGVSSENEKIRHNIEHHLWREAVLARDNFTCQKYGIRSGELHSHHINNFANFPELRTSIENGITLSKKAHIEFHKKYGIKNNTKEQLEEFLQNK